MEACCTRFTAAEGGARLAAAASSRNTLATECSSFIATRLVHEEAYKIRGSLYEGSQRSVYVTRPSRIQCVAYELRILTDLSVIEGTKYNDVYDWYAELDTKQVLVCTSAVLKHILEEAILTMENINVLILDSCHLICKDDNLQYIMKLYKQCDDTNKPRILALTYPLFACNKNKEHQETSEYNSNGNIDTNNTNSVSESNAIEEKSHIKSETEEDILNNTNDNIENDLNKAMESSDTESINKESKFTPVDESANIKINPDNKTNESADIESKSINIENKSNSVEKTTEVENNITSEVNISTDIKSKSTRVGESDNIDINSVNKINESADVESKSTDTENESTTAENTTKVENNVTSEDNISTDTKSKSANAENQSTDIAKESDIENNVAIEEIKSTDSGSKSTDIENKATTKEVEVEVSNREGINIGTYENLDNFNMYEKLEWKIENLENELCCQMDLAEDIDGGKRLYSSFTKPKELLIEYGCHVDKDQLPQSYVDLETFMRDTVNDALAFIDEHRHDPTEIYGDELYEEFKNIPDPTIDPRNLFKQFLYVLEQLGPYAADKAAISLLTKLEKLKIKVPYERHFLLLCLCTTIFVKIRCYADLVFSRYESDWDKIRLFCTPKVMRLAEILEKFKPPDVLEDNRKDRIDADCKKVGNTSRDEKVMENIDDINKKPNTESKIMGDIGNDEKIDNELTEVTDANDKFEDANKKIDNGQLNNESKVGGVVNSENNAHIIEKTEVKDINNVAGKNIDNTCCSEKVDSFIENIDDNAQNNRSNTGNKQPNNVINEEIKETSKEEFKNVDTLANKHVEHNKKDINLASKMLKEIDECNFAALGDKIEDRVNTYEANLKDLDDYVLVDKESKANVSKLSPVDSVIESNVFKTTCTGLLTSFNDTITSTHILTTSNVPSTGDIISTTSNMTITSTENSIISNIGTISSTTSTILTTSLNDTPTSSTSIPTSEIALTTNNTATSNVVSTSTNISSSVVTPTTSNNNPAATNASLNTTDNSTSLTTTSTTVDIPTSTTVNIPTSTTTSTKISATSDGSSTTNIQTSSKALQSKLTNTSEELRPRRLGARIRGRGRGQRQAGRGQQGQLCPDALCGLVFTKDPLMAKILFMLIVDMSRCNPKLSYLCAQYCAAEQTTERTEIKECQRQNKKHEDVLKKFRMHECNLLLATPALEEGIDLPRCNLVLRWDPPSSYRSYGLCRSRARAPRSTAALLCSEIPPHTNTLIHNVATYKELDQVISRKCCCGVQDEPPQSEEDEADMFTSIIKPYTPNERFDNKNSNKNVVEDTVKDKLNVKDDNGMITEVESKVDETCVNSTTVVDYNGALSGNNAQNDDLSTTTGFKLDKDSVVSDKNAQVDDVNAISVSKNDQNSAVIENEFKINDICEFIEEQSIINNSNAINTTIDNFCAINTLKVNNHETITESECKYNNSDVIECANDEDLKNRNFIIDTSRIVNESESKIDNIRSIDNLNHINDQFIYKDNMYSKVKLESNSTDNDNIQNDKSEEYDKNDTDDVVIDKNENAKSDVNSDNFNINQPNDAFLFNKTTNEQYEININKSKEMTKNDDNKLIDNFNGSEGIVNIVKVPSKMDSDARVDSKNVTFSSQAADIRDKETDSVIRDRDSGATVDLNSAIALINRYCGKLPSDTFTRLAPQWWMEKVELPMSETGEMRPAYICTLRLPLNCPVKYNIVGHPMPTRVLARRMVALQACRILHKSGELDNHLMPIGKENFKAAELDASTSGYSNDVGDINDIARPGTTKRRQYYYKRTAWAFTDCQPIVDTSDSEINPIDGVGEEKMQSKPEIEAKNKGTKRNMLYALTSTLRCALPERYNTRGRRLHAPQNANQAMGILMARDEPDNLQIPAFPVYTRSGEVRVSVEHVPDADVRLSPRRGRLIRRFMRFVFAEVLRVRRKGMKLQSEGSTHNNYYIVPTIKTFKEDGTPKIDIDWSFLELIYQHTEEKKHSEIEKPILWHQDEEEDDGNTQDAVREKETVDKGKIMQNPLLKEGEVFVFDEQKYREAVVTPWYRNRDQPQFFLVAEICWNLTPDSAFPSATHSSFRDYYKSKYNAILTQSDQPLLDVDHTSARLNLLTPRYVNRKGVALPVSSERTRRAKRDRLDQKQILVPELCRVHPFAAPLWFATVALPCVLYRINALLIADEIRRAVAIDVGLGVPKIDEKTMPGFQWPPLDFGWSLAEVLNADSEKNEKKREEEESCKKEQKEREAKEKEERVQKEKMDESKKEKTINDILQEKVEAENSFEIGTWSNDMASSITQDMEYDEFMEPLPPNLTFCTSASGGTNWCEPIEKPKSQFNPTRGYSIADSDCSYMSSDFDTDDSDFDSDVSDDETDTSGFCSSKNSNAAMGVRIEYKTAHEAEAVDLERKKVNPAPQPDEADDELDRKEYDAFIRSGQAPDEYIQKFREAVSNHKKDIIDKGLLIKQDQTIDEILPAPPKETKIPKTIDKEKINDLFPYSTENLNFVDGQVTLESIEKNKRVLLDVLKGRLSIDEVKKLNCFSMVDVDIDSPSYVNEKVANVGFDNKDVYMGYTRCGEFRPYYSESKGSFDFDYQPGLEGHPGPSPSVILQALTMSNANDGINLERLETIGDSFLKFAITAYLYCAHPTVHEGKLSHMRSKQVSNLNLYRLGRNKRLGARMIASKFEPHDNWLPPCHKPPSTLHPRTNDNQEQAPQASELPQDGAGCFIPYNLITQHSIPDKSIADCVEALIGAYLLECGPRGALLFMSWLGIRVLPLHYVPLADDHPYVKAYEEKKDEKPPSRPSPKRRRLLSSSSSSSSECSSTDDDDEEWNMERRELKAPAEEWGWEGRPVGSRSPVRGEDGKWMLPIYGELKAPPSPLLRYIEDPEGELEQMLSGYDALERTLQYRFNDRSLLLQALTHASHQRNRLTDCYQRLEFLGDAILDYLITRHLYEDPRRHSPGALTDLRSALVNNTIFATLAARHGFHKFFRHMSPGLNEVLTKYVKIQEENGHSISEEHYLIQEDEMEQAEDVEVPKALGDLFESVAGAIFLDSGMSLGAVWKSYVNLMGAELEAFSAAAPKSPVRELLEAEPDTAKFGKPERLADGRRVRVCVEVFGRGAFKGVGRNYRIAKGTAARCALRHLKIHKAR